APALTAPFTPAVSPSPGAPPRALGRSVREGSEGRKAEEGRRGRELGGVRRDFGNPGGGRLGDRGRSEAGSVAARRTPNHRCPTDDGPRRGQLTNRRAAARSDRSVDLATELQP